MCWPLDGIDKVGLAYGGERFVINVTSPGRPRPLTIFSRLTYTHWGVVRADAPRRIRPARRSVAQRCEGRLAQLVRAPALQAGGRRFESCTAHHIFNNLANNLGLKSGPLLPRCYFFKSGLLAILSPLAVIDRFGGSPEPSTALPRTTGQGLQKNGNEHTGRNRKAEIGVPGTGQM
jgi:hypothetical protein